MNVLVIGLGSMGKRRIELIRELYPDFVIYGVDGREERRKDISDIFKIKCAESVNKANQDYDIDIAFVCTPPLSHSFIIQECLINKWHVFTELNLVSDGYKENLELAESNGCTLFLSSSFFYREEIRYIRNKVSDSSKWNYIYHIGQYLPDWHPWENYEDFFVSDRRTNGCREIMAIELPWITQTFGAVERANVVTDKMSELKVNYNDNYIIQINHTNGNKGVLIVDIVSPVAVRRLEVYAENKYLQWNGTPDTLFEYNNTEDTLKQVHLLEEKHKKGYRSFVVENAYKNEIEDFFDVVFKRKKPLYGFEQDYGILKLIDSLEKQE